MKLPNGVTYFALAYLAYTCATVSTAGHVDKHGPTCFVYISSVLTSIHRNTMLMLDCRRPYCPREYKSSATVVVAFLLLVAGVEPNPGPSFAADVRPLQFGLFNARSAVRKAASVHDVISDNGLDVIALTESWMRSDDPDAITLDVAPPGYSVLHAFHDSTACNRTRGGGVALIYRSTLKATQLPVEKYTQFELMSAKLELSGSKPLAVAVV
jgi:hypothetical protein